MAARLIVHRWQLAALAGCLAARSTHPPTHPPTCPPTWQMKAVAGSPDFIPLPSTMASAPGLCPRQNSVCAESARSICMTARSAVHNAKKAGGG